MEQKILVVDDEPDIREAVALLLRQQPQFSVTLSASGTEAVERIRDGAAFDVIVMDIIMPGLSGTAAAAQIRTMTDCPILFLTAKSSDTDKIEAYDAGGDDYLVKPFSGVELLLRIKTLLRHRGSAAAGGIVMDKDKRRVSKNGHPILLTGKEFDLFEFLYTHRGETFSNAQLYEQVWQDKYLPTSSNTVMVHILNLRKKLEEDFTDPKYIQTVWGKGYCYAKDQSV